MAAKPPDAFLSYTRFDDRHGAISTFRQWLRDIVREVSGEPFDIFQDTDDIDVGERWSDKLEQILDHARFFVPIMTPSYFKSEACRSELQEFLEAEKKAGREDLIIPIYYIECPVLEDKALREGDHLAKVLHGRQRYDWRELRHHSFKNRKVRLEIDALARQINRARQRLVPGNGAAAPSPRQPARDFEDEGRSDRFALITGLSAHLERVVGNLSRLRSGQHAPDGFMRGNEIVPLTEIFGDLEVHRLALGEDFYRLFSRQAQLALKAANVSDLEDWREIGEEWARGREEIRMAAEAAFGTSKIHP